MLSEKNKYLGKYVKLPNYPKIPYKIVDTIFSDTAICKPSIGNSPNAWMTIDDISFIPEEEALKMIHDLKQEDLEAKLERVEKLFTEMKSKASEPKIFYFKNHPNIASTIVSPVIDDDKSQIFNTSNVVVLIKNAS